MNKFEEAAEIEANTPITVGAGRGLPSKPGFYWARWLTCSPGTHEGDQLVPSRDWEVVEVWENFVGEPCEADACEKFGVSVPGVREAQWLENFQWGIEVKKP